MPHSCVRRRVSAGASAAPEPPSPRVKRALVVEDEPRTRLALESALGNWARHVCGAGSVRQAALELQRADFQLVLLDVSLPDGSARDVLEVIAARSPRPVVLALSGVASAEESFALAQRGVRGYLSKPIGAEALDAAVSGALTSPTDLRVHVAAVVGHRAIHEVEAEVRHTMLCEALARSGGSRRAAARMLAISRQLIQHMLRGVPEPRPSVEP